MTENIPSVRLDLWLWAARFYQTRSLAKQAIESGRVEVDGQSAKASRGLKSGERLSVRRGDELFEIEVLALSSKRGSATVGSAGRDAGPGAVDRSDGGGGAERTGAGVRASRRAAGAGPSRNPSFSMRARTVLREMFRIVAVREMFQPV